MRSVRCVSSMMSICLSDSIETKCACCSSVNEQKKKKEKNECICCRSTLKLRRKSALRRRKILNAVKYP